VAVDPHKWLYAPLEAGCALVANGRGALQRALQLIAEHLPPVAHDALANE
jgi:3-deoxy-D-manno-octulosonic-acid transferase